jgi:S-adenosylmethionine-diacylglycerol 3-amino-3-carboxypropyl transferase
MTAALALKTHLSNRVFNWVHKFNLIYNTCWEDPALDRVALNLSPNDRLLVISSAGCNALDYLIAGCGEVHAVDLNPIQNALLELKVAGIKSLDYQDFDRFFGDGYHRDARDIYQTRLRDEISDMSKAFWDRNISYFCGKGWRESFYYRGTAGLLAKFLTLHLFHVKSLRPRLEDLINARTLDEQKELYEAEIKPRLWSKWMHWILSRDVTMSLMGVPPDQKKHMATQFPGGIQGYFEQSLEAVLTQLPFRENYFYRVYIEGRYPRDCRPEYLREENFENLKNRINHLYIHTGSVAHFLEATNLSFSRYVLLDHMDWLSLNQKQELEREWNAIFSRATEGARAIYRSAALNVTYLDDISIKTKLGNRRLGDVLIQNSELAAQLHMQDRVHTYASFYIADIKPA